MTVVLNIVKCFPFFILFLCSLFSARIADRKIADNQTIVHTYLYFYSFTFEQRQNYYSTAQKYSVNYYLGPSFQTQLYIVALYAGSSQIR